LIKKEKLPVQPWYDKLPRELYGNVSFDCVYSGFSDDEMESIHSQEERLNKIVIKFKRRNSMPCGGSDKLVSSTEIK
jgi:hypothetical protein